MKRATLKTTEAEVLTEENSRLRAALENIRDLAGLQAVSALMASKQTTAVGLTHLGRLASDALEAA